ncbi:WSC-domain-containing protein [Thozetella sp. PMI_491]|nr:WSC-domain-containing protein [Thozetella sp. PMI_491]
MKAFGLVRSLLSLALCKTALSWDPTDSLMDADSAATGYLPNHNMDPSVITGGAFGQIWAFTVPTSSVGQTEQFYAKPLVYTPSSIGRQVVLAFSEQNRIYVLDAVNGTMYNMRDMGQDSPSEAPFWVSDLGSCNDISGTIGITGTPIIDNTTDTVYFWAKSYQTPGQRGYQNGAYRFHAIDAWTLKERPGFPTNVEGKFADNDNTRYFTGGGVLQRTSLNMINGVVYAGFGGHCDMYNYTGWVVGMKASTGDFVTAYSTSAGSRAPAQDGTWNGGGGGCGIWQGGSIISSDNSGRLFFATGNGYRTTVNGQTAASGRTHLDTLSECMVSMSIASNGSITQQDYFEPYTYQAIDSADRDVGSGGVSILPFSGGGVNRLAVTAGKNGQCYITNADNLGGYKMASGGGDSIIQTITPPTGTAMFGNVGAYPLEGGYMYITPVGSPTYAYALGYDSSGKPAFSLAGATSDSSAGRVGTGSPTITSLNGQPGTAIIWMSDPDNGVRAYYAVPNGGKLTKITLPATPVLPKFQRPVFGNGRYYTATYTGQILGFGSPVQLPFDCGGPFNFGEVSVGQSQTININCTAKININKISNITIGNVLYNASLASLPTGAIKAGTTFSFPVTFNLTGYVLDAGSTSSPTIQPGVQSGSITILSQNGVTGYSNQQPLSVTGTTITASAFAAINPVNVNFSPLVLGSASAGAGSDNTLVIQNLGKGNMTILGYGYTINDPTSGTAKFVNVTVNATGQYRLDANGYFTTTDLPALNSVIAGGSSVIVHMNFLCQTLGDYYTTFTIWTNGGMAASVLTGSANAQPIALLEVSTNEGGWNTISGCSDPTVDCASQIDFGTSTGLTNQRRTIRITNNGGSDLIIDKSKPPVGTVLGAENPSTDLYEGMVVKAGSSSTASIFFSPPSTMLNSDPTVYSGAWTLNVNDLTWGVHILNFTGTLQGARVGPTLADGTPRFKYLGCYKDSTNARLETTSQNNANNTNGACQSYAVTNKAAFAATEYTTECWVGRNIPSDSLKVSDYLCQNYVCPGDSTQMCGGVGSYALMWYDTTGYFPSNKSLSKAFQPPSYKSVVGNYVYYGCRTDSTSSRTLSKSIGATSTNTLESCATACKGYTFFGVEYGTECYCGNTIGSSSGVGVESTCSYTCAGDVTELCGGSSRISVYALNGTVVSSSSSTSSSATGTATSAASAISSTAVSAPTQPASVGSYAFVGCYNDTVGARALVDGNTQSDSMSVESCAAYCSGYQYFAVEYSAECYCGNKISNGGAIVTDGRCNMVCNGNALEYCGGTSGLSLYSRGNTTASATTSTSSAASSTLTSTSKSSSVSTSPATSSTSTTSSSTISSKVSTSSSSTTSSATPSATAVFTCPDSNNSTYTSANGKTFLAECYIDHAQGDLGGPVYLSSWATCAEVCSTTTNCVAFSWQPGTLSPCYLKQAVGAPNSNSGVFGAKIIAWPTTSSSVISSSASASSTQSLSSSASTSTSSLSSAGSTTTSVAASTPSSTFLSSSTVSTTSSISASSSLASSSTSSSSSIISSSTTSSSSIPSTSATSSASSSTSSSSSVVVAATTTSSSTVVSSSTSSQSATSTSVSSNQAVSTSSTSQSSTVSSTTSTVATSSSSTSSSQAATSTSTSSSQSTTTSSTSKSSTTSSTSSSTSSSSSASSSQAVTTSSTSMSSTTSSTSSTVASSSSSTSSSQATTSSSTSSSQALPTSSTSKSSTASTSSTSSTATTGSSTSSLVSTASSSVSATPTLPPWSYMGCASDSTSARSLNGTSTTNSAMTVEMCQTFCASNNYPLAGVEYSTQCYCGLDLAPSYTYGQTGCTMVCGGDGTETCGGRSRVSVYKNNTYVQPSLVQSSGAAVLQGCYVDSSSARLLSKYTWTSSTTMSVDACVSTCSKRGFAVSGVEYGGECYCGNDIPAATSLATGTWECQAMFCTGNTLQFCGGKSRMLVYA